MLTPVEWAVFGFVVATVLLGLVFVQRLQTNVGEVSAQFQWHPELEVRPKKHHASTQTQNVDRWLHRVVDQSGIGMDLSTFLIANFCLAIVGGGIAWMFAATLVVQIFTGVTLFAFGVIGVWIMFKRQRKKFEEQFPIALELMSCAVSAGECFADAVGIAHDSTQDPVKRELKRCMSKMDMGLADDEAMQLLAHRIPTMEVRIFSHTVSVHREMGGQLAKTLQRLANVIQERREYKQKIWSATSLGRFAAIMISGIGIAALSYLVFCQPEYIGKLLASPLGIRMTLYAVISEIVGIIWIFLAMGPEV